MAAADVMKARPAKTRTGIGVTQVRLILLVVIFGAWEVMARSGLLYRDVVPPLETIGLALVKLLSNGMFYWNLGVTVSEVLAALVIGGCIGFMTGVLLGGSRFFGRALEPYIYYLGPTPKIIFFPIMIMWFGVGPGSKIAMGAVSCFFPIALSAAASMRQIDAVLIRVGRSFRANQWQMAMKIYLPAMRPSVMNGIRLGLGIAIIGTLLAETKLSNKGVGYLIMQAYSVFDMPRMYALLITLFAFAIGANAIVGRFGGPATRK